MPTKAEPLSETPYADEAKRRFDEWWFNENRVIPTDGREAAWSAFRAGIIALALMQEEVDADTK